MMIVLDAFLGCLAGALAGVAYFAALRWSLERNGAGRTALLLGAALRLLVALAAIGAALWLGAGPAHLAGGLAGFVLVRRAAISAYLRQQRRRP